MNGGIDQNVTRGPVEDARKECLYPDCHRPPKPRKGSRGPAPGYCEDPSHNRVTAHRRRKELEEQKPLDHLTLGQIRRVLNRLTALASLGERPVPTSINPPDHPASGCEWKIEQAAAAGRTSAPPVWRVRLTTKKEAQNSIFVSTPNPTHSDEGFVPMSPEDAVRLGLALIAAAEYSPGASPLMQDP